MPLYSLGSYPTSLQFSDCSTPEHNPCKKTVFEPIRLSNKRIHMSIDQYGIHIWLLYIRWYGMILMAGAVAAAFLAEREARRRGLKSEFFWDALIWVLIAGIVGARLWHVFTPPPSMVALGYTTKYYLTHPLALINTRAGGLGIVGAVIGGAIALYLYSRYKKQNFLMWADIAAPGVALAQAIGRWGNFLNQELYC